MQIQQIIYFFKQEITVSVKKKHQDKTVRF